MPKHESLHGPYVGRLTCSKLDEMGVDDFGRGRLCNAPSGEVIADKLSATVGAVRVAGSRNLYSLGWGRSTVTLFEYLSPTC